MPVIKNEFPILEYDTSAEGVIKPNRHGRNKLPHSCIITFFGDVLQHFAKQKNAAIVNSYRSEMRDFPVYAAEHRGVEVCIIQAVVGSGSIAMMTDFLIGHGIKNIIACGGCGVLTDIPPGDVIIPVSALRDEGASYHYLPPARDIELDRDIISLMEDTLTELKTPYIKCKTWTTDGFYRETPDMITYRKEEGCQVVEMECATMASIAKFRQVKFGQLLYSGDILVDFDNYDERNWAGNLTAREKLFFLALETAVKL